MDKRAIPIELGLYFNAKGVSWMEPYIPASINHIQESICGELLPNNEQIQVSGIPFTIPRTDTPGPDMISVENQRIAVPEGCYEQLAVLGFSTWGDFFDELTIVYEDGAAKAAPFGFHNWKCFDPGKRVHGEGLVMEYFRYGNETVREAVKVELVTLELDRTKPVKQIITPDNVFTYIIAMTLVGGSGD